MKHSPQARILVSTLTAAITMVVAWSIMHAPIRNPASADAATSASSQSKPTPRSTPTVRKPSTSVSVSIEQIEQTLPTLGLRGQIRADHALSGYQFAWIVSDGDKIVDGVAAGSVPAMNAGDTLDIKVQVAPAPHSKNPVVLHVYQLINGEPRGVIAQWDFPTNRSAEQGAAGNGEKAAQLPDGLVQ
ncbi:MAG: hypothetical protein IPJ84_01035 [Bdellovibrionales bacterium]|nr:hypothetical protein [Bdellovibrionales bacterium]